MRPQRLTLAILVTVLVPCIVGLTNGASAQTTTPAGRLVKQIAQRHEGRVQVASDGPGHGMVFTVTLPCATTH